jgi:hypothetical protein
MHASFRWEPSPRGACRAHAQRAAHAARAPLCSTPRPDGVAPSPTITNEYSHAPLRLNAPYTVHHATYHTTARRPCAPRRRWTARPRPMQSAVAPRPPTPAPTAHHRTSPAHTVASVPDIATVSNSAVPLVIASTPPSHCARAHRAAARPPQKPGIRPIEPRTGTRHYNASHGNGAAGRLRGADATQADATQADATGADATQADATGAEETQADATRADETCNVRRRNLKRATMQHANARRCNV